MASTNDHQLFVRWGSRNRLLDVRYNPNGTCLDFKTAIEKAGGPLVKDQKLLFQPISDDTLIDPYDHFGQSAITVFGPPPSSQQ
jgi:hypothetical protein